MESDYITIKSAKNCNDLKILISMHPVDRCNYLERLICGITDNNNCTVCYSPFPADNSVTDFTDIDMVIAGVTEKYITWNNSGFVAEAMAALRNNIPVLPIMLESGIINLFNTRVGKLHYIENLSNEISEETVIQVNEHILRLTDDSSAVWDKDKPEIFISYRKRDKKELQRLVKLIDAHPERDKISLWYDTNLNPGDNYKLTIMEQLKSCDLFLMLVTPNILEPDNYVVRVEYPLALKEKKHILPIVMQKTDLKKLYEQFPRLPKCITDTQTDAIFSKIKISE